MNGLLLPDRQVFLVDTHVNYDPTRRAADRDHHDGGRGNAALWHQAQGGPAVALQLRQQQPAQRRQDAPDAGAAARAGARGWKWMAKCTATSPWTARRARALMPHSTLAGDANLLVLPNIDAANISYNLLKTAAGGNIAIGPVLLGAAKPVHILTASATVRRIVNMTALTVADANAHDKPRNE
jgi:malate dehydrogenase (oxaloacetate-decarboxylating)(NADP+)